MQNLKILDKLGLKSNDQKVYFSLLELGSASIKQLIEKTHLHRSYIYDILDNLMGQGLVSFFIKDKKRYFNAEDPQKLFSVIEKKKQELSIDSEELKKIIPIFIKKQEKVLSNQEAMVFTGKEGIKSILEDVLKNKQDFYAFGAEGKFKEIFTWYFDNWQNRRIKLKISSKIIYSSKLKNKRFSSNKIFSEVRFLDSVEFPSTIIVYSNKVAILIWDFQPIGFVIKSEKVYKSFLNYFQILWKVAKA